MKQKAIFFDRDGTLVEEVNFLSNAEETRLFPYTVDALSLLRDAGFVFFVTTNQSGIGRGYFAVEDMNSVHKQIESELAMFGLEIENFQFCPHLPDEGCACRKPNIGMIEEAIADLDIDIENSWTIGDKRLDIEMGFNAGTKTALVRTGYGAEDQFSLERQPDLIADNILLAAKIIVSQMNSET